MTKAEFDFEEHTQTIIRTDVQIGVYDTLIQTVMDTHGLPEHAQQTIIHAIEERSKAATEQFIATEQAMNVIEAQFALGFVD